MKFYFYTFFTLLFFQFYCSYAQDFELSGQIRPRAEYRHGYKSLFDDNYDPATAISQRTRLKFFYSSPKFKTMFSFQNINIWGELKTNTNYDVNGFSVYQAWGELFVDPELSLKLGRQEINYDDQRLFSISNWGQAGRRHDAILFKYEPENFQIHLGAAFNQDADKDTGTFYGQNNYKSLQFMRFHYDDKSLSVSFYILNNGFAHNVVENSISKQYIRYSQTVGPFVSFKKEDYSLNASAYYQFGKNSKNKDLSAYLLGALFNYKVTKNFGIGIGGELISGNNQDELVTEDHEFVLSFTSSHKFNGSMDYFYSSKGHGGVGLLDIYMPITYKYDKLQFVLNPHYFAANANIINKNKVIMDKFLGVELDFNVNYSLANDLSIELGYSQMFGTESLQLVKGGNYKLTQNWAYVMFTFTPSIFKFNI